MSCRSAEEVLCRNCDLFWFQLRSNELPNLHVDGHAQVFADDDWVEVSLGTVYFEAQPREQGEGVVLQL